MSLSPKYSFSTSVQNLIVNLFVLYHDVYACECADGGGGIVSVLYSLYLCNGLLSFGF